MPDFDLSITICSWNAVEDLRRCLASLRERTGETKFEVIVVENNSEDGSGDMCRAEFPEFTCLQQTQNLGFTGGHNLARSHIQGRHWFPLNSDTVVHEGALAKLVAFADSRPDVGVVGPKLLNGDGSLQYSCRRFPNPVAAAFRNTFLGRIFPNNRFTREYLMRDMDHKATCEVDWVSGAAILITETALPHLGQFDPEFYMFCEDVDICRRSWDIGLKVVYFPEAEITHLIGRSTDKAPKAMTWRFHRSMLLYYRKHMVSKLPRWVRPFAVFGAATALSLRASTFLLKNKVQEWKRALRRG
ncbi:MAG: glycosyltransferase family 2 protein [Chthonomonas sp.]|nr:glycosyltransferase family 2 protein [Chthonomonas sp.]